MKKIFLLIIITFIIVGCSIRKEEIPCYNSKEFKDAILVLNDTETIVMYSRYFDEKERKIKVNKIMDINVDKVDKIVNILIKSNEWTGPITQPFPSNELQFYNKEGEKIATFIYNGASDLVVDNKTFVLTDYDKELLDKLLNNSSVENIIGKEPN